MDTLQLALILGFCLLLFLAFFAFMFLYGRAFLETFRQQQQSSERQTMHMSTMVHSVSQATLATLQHSTSSESSKNGASEGHSSVGGVRRRGSKKHRKSSDYASRKDTGKEKVTSESQIGYPNANSSAEFSKMTSIFKDYSSKEMHTSDESSSTDRHLTTSVRSEIPRHLPDIETEITHSNYEAHGTIDDRMNGQNGQYPYADPPEGLNHPLELQMQHLPSGAVGLDNRYQVERTPTFGHHGEEPCPEEYPGFEVIYEPSDPTEEALTTHILDAKEETNTEESAEEASTETKAKTRRKKDRQKKSSRSYARSASQPGALSSAGSRMGQGHTRSASSSSTSGRRSLPGLLEGPISRLSEMNAGSTVKSTRHYSLADVRNRTKQWKDEYRSGRKVLKSDSSSGDGGSTEDVASSPSLGLPSLPSADFSRANERYLADACNPGKILIINNIKFEGLVDGCPLSEREGAHLDTAMLRHMFNRKGWHDKDVMHYENRTAEEIKRSIRALTEGTIKPWCIVVFIMTHGKLGTLYGSDCQEVNIIADVLKPLYDSECEYLNGVPKLFFFQACRKEIYVEPLTSRRGHVSPTREGATRCSYDVEPALQGDCGGAGGDKILWEESKMDHMLVAYSCKPSEESYRETDRGSIFIQQLVHHLSSADNHHIENCCVNVKNSVVEISKKYGKQQLPCYRLLLHKALYLYQPP